MPYKLRTEHEKSFRDTGSGALFLTPTESIVYLLAFSNRKQVFIFWGGKSPEGQVEF